MHHREQIVGPVRQMPRPLVTMADEWQFGHLRPQTIDVAIGNIPNRHAVVTVAQFVVVGHRGDAADDPVSLHPCQPLHNIFDR